MTKSILIERLVQKITAYHRLRVARFSVYNNNVGLIKRVPREHESGRHDIQIPFDEETKYYCPASKEEGLELLQSFIGIILRRNLTMINLAQGDNKLCTVIKDDLQKYSKTALSNTTAVSVLLK